MTARDITRPRPCYGMLRLVRGGPLVPCAIKYESTQHAPGEPDNPIERPGCLVAYIAGEQVEIAAVWERRYQECSEQDYLYALALLLWRRQHEAADPLAPLDCATAAPPF